MFCSSVENFPVGDVYRVALNSGTKMLVGIAFGLFGVSHLANLLGFAQAWESSLVVIRTLGYLIVIYALFRLALVPYSKT